MDHTYTNLTGQSILFDIVVDDVLYNLLNDVDPNNKAILSIVNDFEDGVGAGLIWTARRSACGHLAG